MFIERIYNIVKAVNILAKYVSQKFVNKVTNFC